MTIPTGFHTVTPFLMAKEPDKLAMFLSKAFSAQLITALRGEDGRMQHGQFKIGDSMVLLGDAMGKPVDPQMLYVYVANPDAAYQQAKAAGAETISELQNWFYGDRNAGVKDPEGHTWWLATQVEQLSQEEITERAREFEKKMKETQKPM